MRTKENKESKVERDGSNPEDENSWEETQAWSKRLEENKGFETLEEFKDS